jgi:hypothetical protein
LLAALHRWRRPLLVAAVAVAIGHPVLRSFQGTQDAPLTDMLYHGLVAVLAAPVFLAMVRTQDDKPAELVARPDVPAFEAVPGMDDLGPAMFLVLIIGRQVGSLVQGERRLAAQIIEVVLITFLAAVTALQVVGAWQGTGWRVRPDGLSWRTPFRSVHIPWAALAPDGPPRPDLRASHLEFAYARPELVRRRGLRPRADRFLVGRVHPWFLTDVIRHYVAHPEHRPAIGTEAEHRRLLGVLGVDAAEIAGNQSGRPGR